MASPAAAGLAFALTLLDGGRTISSDHFSLKVPGARGALVLKFEGLDFYSGTLAAPVRLRNDTDADLYALEVGLVSVTESPQAPGASPEAGRPLPATAGKPPTWTALPKGTETRAELFKAGPIALDPEHLVILLGVVSGVAATGAFEIEGAKYPRGVETDAAGSVFVTDDSGRTFRTGPAGEKPVELKGPPPTPSRRPESDSGCTRFRAAGHPCRVAPDGIAWVIEERDVSAYAADGGKLRSFRPGGEGPPVALAFGKEGRLYVATAGEEGRSGSIRIFRPF